MRGIAVHVPYAYSNGVITDIQPAFDTYTGARRGKLTRLR